MDTNDPNTAKIILTPDRESIGVVVFNISVTDAEGESDKIEITLEILNQNDPPIVSIISPPEYDELPTFRLGERIDFEATVIDYDEIHGDIVTYKWTSDIDGELGTEKAISIDDLTVGEHVITFTAEDSDGEMGTTDLRLIIGGVDIDTDTLPDNWEREYFGGINKYASSDDPDKDGYTNFHEYEVGSDPMDEDDPEKQPSEEGVDMGFYGLVAAGIIIPIIIVLLLLYLFVIKKKKPKEEEERPIEMITPGDEGRSVEPRDFGYIPQQATTCPKCNSLMTFSPGGLFCLNCGFKMDKDRMPSAHGPGQTPPPPPGPGQGPGPGMPPQQPATPPPTPPGQLPTQETPGLPPKEGPAQGQGQPGTVPPQQKPDQE
jgi:hypothetical protein